MVGAVAQAIYTRESAMVAGSSAAPEQVALPRRGLPVGASRYGLASMAGRGSVACVSLNEDHAAALQ